jgi:regulator of sirC expression with transglutaminase-like and TPR domain
MSASVLAELMTDTRAPLEEVALAIAAEFESVGDELARRRLDRLAEDVNLDGLGEEAGPRARELTEALGVRAGFTVCDGESPLALMLDRVLETRHGHPLALAILYAAVARRAGLELWLVGDECEVILASPRCEPPVAVDPVPGGRELQHEMRWLCPHMVAFRLINAIGERYLRRGDLARGIRAAELRTQLPLDPAAIARHELALERLRACLN